MANIWTVANNYTLGNLAERVRIEAGELSFPVATGATVKHIAGNLPNGMRIDGTDLVGTPSEVQLDKRYRFVIRATLNDQIEDRTLVVNVDGPDTPIWLTQEGLISISDSNNLFVLDSEFIDYQLLAIDPDISAGQTLNFYIASGDGTLPPGLELTPDGKIKGVVEPLLALDKRAQSGGWDTSSYDVYPNDFAINSDNGFDSYFYDNVLFDYATDSKTPKKLNRYYSFRVSVSDGISEPVATRKFQIYVVGDDYLRADNTIMKVANGVFKADNTNVRTPKFLTPSDLGYKRADNNITLYVEVLDSNTIEGNVLFSLEEFNDDGTPCVLPAGCKLGPVSGEITGYVPYQPAVTEEYKFTIKATRYTNDVDFAFITATVYEDTLAGNRSFKIYKLPRNVQDGIQLNDGIDDLNDLRGEAIELFGQGYLVESVDGSNEDYDILTLSTPLLAKAELVASKNSVPEAKGFYVNTTTQYTKTAFIGQTLRYSDNEVYTVENIYPYKHWRITSNDFNIGVSLTAADVTTLQSETLSQQITRIFQGTDLPVTVLQADRNHIEFIAPATAKTIEARIKKIFYPDEQLGGNSALTYTLVDTGNDFVVLDRTLLLGREFIVDQRIGLALTADDFFEKSLITQANQDITNPETNKTFTVNIIGEIDSTIKWLSPANLGEIKANYISTLRVEAQSTVPDAKMLYSITNGNLPNGLRLTYTGEIIGKPLQYGNISEPGLTLFDSGNTVFDTNTTTIDRQAKFTVKAQDRFGYSAIEQEFTIDVVDTDDKLYSNLYIQPLVQPQIRNDFQLFVNDPDIFPPESIYRPNDPNFGIQQKIKMLAYAGIETKLIDEYVAKSAKWHKRRKLHIGDVKTAIAKNPGTNDIVYEIVYLEIVDPKDKDGKVAKTFSGIIDPVYTADSVSYEFQDDISEINTGSPSVTVDGRFLDPAVTLDGPAQLSITTRNGAQTQAIDNNDIDITLRDSTEENIDITLADSEPLRRRKYDRNTLKSDSDAVVLNDANESLYHITNITNMRESLEQIGASQREYLPLWMRTGQDNTIKELDYVPAVPLAYCKPGQSRQVYLNIINALSKGIFDPKTINFEVDRYVLDSAIGISDERYILFANYRYNA